MYDPSTMETILVEKIQWRRLYGRLNIWKGIWKCKYSPQNSQ